MQLIGPIKIVGLYLNDHFMVPLATFERPLWPSVKRGARVAMCSGGICTTLLKECMTRSIILEADHAQEAQQIVQAIHTEKAALKIIAAQSSRFIQLTDYQWQIVANLIYLRFEFTTGDAAGHNMVTLAADHIISWLLKNFSQLRYVAISGNFCTDKKVSAVNGILGRGKSIIAELLIDREICMRYLKTTPEKIVDLNIKKNFIGSNIAGSLRSANAHFANILLAFYLAIGQDAANIVEGSQGITHAEMRNNQLYFSVNLPNIIVGSVGNGKELPFVQANLESLGCTESRSVGENARRLALIAAAAVLCGELSLLAAQTHPYELIKSHLRLERRCTKNEIS